MSHLSFSDLSGYRGTFTPAHLWFILFLFVISMAVLPVCIATLRHRRENGIGSFGRLFEKGWFLVLLFIPLLISEALPDISGKNPFFYAMYYMNGFFIASNENAWKVIDKIKWLSLILVAVSVPLFLFSVAAHTEKMTLPGKVYSTACSATCMAGAHCFSCLRLHKQLLTAAGRLWTT